MIIKYKLKESDYLSNQLFMASISERVKTKRRKSITHIPIVYLVIAVIGFATHSIAMGVAFIILSALWYFLYPFYQTKKYYKHYKGFVEDKYKDICESEVSIKLNGEILICRDNKAESKIQIDAINEIYELPDLYLLNINKANNLLVPKIDIDNKQNYIQELIKELNIQHHIKVHNHNLWEWK